MLPCELNEADVISNWLSEKRGYKVHLVTPKIGNKGRLIELAKESCAKAVTSVGVHVGRVVSGDQFISDKAVKERISSEFAGYCTEMEGAAIAQAAYLNKVPLVILRAISDKADDSATMDYPTFEKQAIANSVLLLKELVSRI